MILDILQCVCGFLAQMLPCAFFCMYPFRDSFRYRRKNALIAFAILLTALTASFTGVYIKLQIPVVGDVNKLPLDIIFLVSLVLFLLLYLFCIDARTVHKLFVFFMMINYGFFVSKTSSYLIKLLFKDYEDYLYSPRTLLFLFLLNGILFFPMLDLMRYTEKALKSHISDKNWRNLTLLPAVFVLTLLVFYELPYSAVLSPSFILELFSKAMMVFLFVFCHWTFRLIDQEQTLAEEQVRLAAMVENYRSAADSAEKVREARHEIMHHVAALSILIKGKDYAGAENYLDKISRTTYAIPDPPHTPHPLLNSMLSDYKKKADDAHIQVTYHIFVQASLQIDDSDLCQLVANLLDNALEGCAHVEPDKRTLQLTIRLKGNFLFFSCENSCDPSRIKFVNGQLLSTKDSPDSKAHGFGIPIMERIVEKYNGVLRTSVNGEHFTVDINMCLT